MNPTLKKLRSSRLSPAQIADLLAKHAGGGFWEMHCLDALAAVETIPDGRVKHLLRVTDLLLGANGVSPCERLNTLIEMLRSDVIGEVFDVGTW